MVRWWWDFIEKVWVCEVEGDTTIYIYICVDKKMSQYVF